MSKADGILHVFGGQLDPCCSVTDGGLLMGLIL